MEEITQQNIEEEVKENVQTEDAPQDDSRSAEDVLKDIEKLGVEVSHDDDKEENHPVEDEDKPGQETEKPEKPAETKPEEEEKPKDGDEDEDDEDYLPPEKRDGKWYAKQRRKKQKLRDELIEAKKELELLKSGQVSQQHSQQQTQTLQDDQAAAFARNRDVNELARHIGVAVNGGFEGDPSRGLSADEQNKQVLHYARMSFQKELSVPELKGIIEQAQAGMYGDHSNDVANEAVKAIPFAYMREQEQANKVTAQHKAAEQTHQERLKLLSSVHKEMPEFADPNSEISKYSDDWFKEWVGITNEQGQYVQKGIMPYDLAYQVLARPDIQARLVKNDLLAKKYDGLLSENKRLKTQLEKLRPSPEPSSEQMSETGGSLSGADAVLAKIESEFGKLR